MSLLLFTVISSILNRTEDLLVVRNEISSSYYYFFPHFLSGRFLRDDLMDLLEIFRVDVKVKEVDCFLLSSKYSLPVGKYGRFSFFKKRSCP